MALPPPPLRSPQKWVFTHAVFSSQYTYVRNLNLWHTKTEKRLQDKPTTTTNWLQTGCKKAFTNSGTKRQTFFQTESLSERR